MSRRARSDAAAPRLSVVTPRASPGPSGFRTDGWANQVTGVGTMRDKRMSAVFSPDYFTQPELELMYRGNDIAARIVDDAPKEMVRMGFEVLSDDKDGAEAVNAAAGQGGDDSEIPALPVLKEFEKALRHRRAFGGGAVLLGVDDGQDPIMPLDESRIRSFTYLTAFTPEEMQPASRYTDPMHPKYGKPKVYRLIPMIAASAGILGPDVKAIQPASYQTLIHETRIIAFEGNIVSRRQQALSYNFGWGDGELARAWRVIRDFDTSWDGAAHLLQDFSQGVLKIKGLYQLVASTKDGDQNGVATRLMALDMMRSIARLIPVDADGEDFERKTTPLSGYPEMLDRFSNRVSAAARMPVSRLLGQAPAGLNAT